MLARVTAVTAATTKLVQVLLQATSQALQWYLAEIAEQISMDPRFEIECRSHPYDHTFAVNCASHVSCAMQDQAGHLGQKDAMHDALMQMFEISKAVCTVHLVQRCYRQLGIMKHVIICRGIASCALCHVKTACQRYFEFQI